jgi:hypothetical protein
MNTLTKHPHAEIILKIAEHVASGAFDAGFHELQAKHRDGIRMSFGKVKSWIYVEPTLNLDVNGCWEYHIIKTDKHPDNQKPKKKLIDWSKMPKGTMTNQGELISHVSDHNFCVVLTGHQTTGAHYGGLRLEEQTDFTYWSGGDCPVPAGVTVEVIGRDGEQAKGGRGAFHWKHRGINQDSIAYRITGLTEGWTDNPEGAV